LQPRLLRVAVPTIPECSFSAIITVSTSSMANSMIALMLVGLAASASYAQEVEGRSALRESLIGELRSARQQMAPEDAGSSLRYNIIDELRLARKQAEPPRSALRDEIIAELREARKQSEPPRSALRDEIISELQAARQQSDAQEEPSALRKEIVEELRNARQTLGNDAAITQVEHKVKTTTPAHVQEQELPWDEAEVLLTDAEASAPVAAVAAAASTMNEQVLAFNRLLRTLVLYGTALGLASAAKLPELDLKVQGRSPAHVVTLVLFFVPLLAVSADFVFDLAVGNEFALIAGSWGLGAMACVHERMKQQ